MLAFSAHRLPRRRAIVRDEAFLHRSMREFGPAVYGLALVQTGSYADAQDVYQDVFVRLATDETSFDLDAADPAVSADAHEHLKAWLLRVAVNRCRDRARAPWARRTVSLEELLAPAGDSGPADAHVDARIGPAAFSDPADLVLERWEARAVWRAVDALKPALREVVYLRYCQELSCDEIARVTGSKPSTVRTRLQRARDQLRTLLGGSAHDQQ